MREVVIVQAARTPIGSFNGSLSKFTATELGGLAMKEVLNRSGLDASQVDEVIMGNVLPHGLGQNPARQALFKAEIPYEAGAVTVNKVCGSGLKAVMLAAQAIACGDAEVVIAGGMESMTNSPYLLDKARSGYRMGHAQMMDAMIRDGLWDINNDLHMGNTAEGISDKFVVSREDQDRFAEDSYNKAIAAEEAGLLDEERFTVQVPQRKKDPIAFEKDEIIRPTPYETLAKMRPAFKRNGGTVTAGNASKIADGAAAVLLTSKEYAEANNLSILATVGAQASAC